MFSSGKLIDVERASSELLASASCKSRRFAALSAVLEPAPGANPLISAPYVSDIRYDYRSDYGEGPGDVPGQAIGVFSRNLRDGNDANTPDTYTSNAFTWWDGAVQSSITHRPRTDQSTLYTSTFNRDTLGTLQSVQVEDGRRRTVTFVSDIGSKPT